MVRWRWKPHWDGRGRIVSFVQLSDIARHFHTGDELGVTRFSSCLSQGNAMPLVCCRKSGPFFFKVVTNGLLTLHASIKTGIEDLLLTPPAWQFRDRPVSHLESGCHQIDHVR